MHYPHSGKAGSTNLTARRAPPAERAGAFYIRACSRIPDLLVRDSHRDSRGRSTPWKQAVIPMLK